MAGWGNGFSLCIHLSYHWGEMESLRGERGTVVLLLGERRKRRGRCGVRGTAGQERRGGGSSVARTFPGWEIQRDSVEVEGKERGGELLLKRRNLTEGEL